MYPYTWRSIVSISVQYTLHYKVTQKPRVRELLSAIKSVPHVLFRDLGNVIEKWNRSIISKYLIYAINSEHGKCFAT